MILVHATCIAVEGAGVLLRGASGCGKSDLALRLVAAGARLVADDQVICRATAEGQVQASPPPALAGWLEVRGIGIVPLPYQESVPLVLVVDLLTADAEERDAGERLPPVRTCSLAGVVLPWVALAPFQASAVARLHVAVREARAGRLGRIPAAFADFSGPARPFSASCSAFADSSFPVALPVVPPVVPGLSANACASEP